MGKQPHTALTFSIVSPLIRGVKPFTLIALILVGCAHQAPEPAPKRPQPGDGEVLALKLFAVAEVDPATTRNASGIHGPLVELARDQRCPCPGVDGSLAECAQRGGGGCIRAPFAVRSIIRGLLRKEKPQAIHSLLMERFGPREPETIDIKGAPCRGSATAPVTMVVFSDFQCPYCGLAVRAVRVVEKEAGEKLRVCFKHWPLKRHPRARPAAMAAVAAQRQGKFWPMHDKLFSNAKELERPHLQTHAMDLGLDMKRFEQDLDSAEVKALVERDIAEARRLKLGGTPAFLINGRRMTDHKTVPDFLDWIAEAVALKKAGGRVAGE